ncbi:MAG: hypothetical protein KDD36_01390 [Flavobacteriales bacterium]|nr:hypothetical protein [Flavobacteriales bacterium]
MGYAQDDNALEPKPASPNKEEKAGYVPPNDGQRYHKVVLVPYNPMMHLSDADVDIVQYSGLPLKKVHARFRGELNATLNMQLKKIYPLKDLMMEEIENESEDLDRIYHSIGYKMEKARPSYLNEEAKEASKKTIFEKMGIGKNAEENPEPTNEASEGADAYIQYHDKDREYLESKISDPDLIPYLSNKYHADLFVFINQIEIKTNYTSCLDLANKVYEREIRVHFTIRDAEGKVVLGDVAVTVFPSNSNDIGEITANNYPMISEYIAKSIPQPHDTVEEKREQHDKLILRFQRKTERKQSKMY